MKQKKYYVVWKGRKTGIFDTWEECKVQIEDFAGAAFKSFLTLDEAAEAFNRKHNFSNSSAKQAQPIKTEKPIPEAYCVDAACSGNPGQMEYRCVILKTGEIFFRSKVYKLGTNNIGEFLAVVHCLARLKKLGMSNVIYTDSANALAWLKHKKCKTKLEKNSQTRELFDVIERAEQWLEQNSYSNPVLKWDTDRWGEIPADFGRK